MAHHAAIRSNGSTIAVLGGGLRHIYPRSNQALFDKLAVTQLVLSEYYPDQNPQQHHFPREKTGLSADLVFVHLSLKQKSIAVRCILSCMHWNRERCIRYTWRPS